MATIEVVVCDVCGDQSRSATRYDIRSEGRSVRVDLCEEHADAAPLRRLMEEGKTGAGSRRFENVSMTVEEIEARKKRKQS